MKPKSLISLQTMKQINDCSKNKYDKSEEMSLLIPERSHSDSRGRRVSFGAARCIPQTPNTVTYNLNNFVSICSNLIFRVLKFNVLIFFLINIIQI